jgi:hypothetical protein
MSDSPEADLLTSEEAQAIDWLGGRDKLGLVGDGLGVMGGAASGAAAAGTAASIAGATTILGSTTLGGLLGGIFVASTPIGWVIGTAAVGGAIGYGIVRLARSGGRQDERRQTARERILEQAHRRRVSGPPSPEMERQVAHCSAQALGAGLVKESDLARMRGLLVAGRLTHTDALARLQGLLGNRFPQEEGS